LDLKAFFARAGKDGGPPASSKPDAVLDPTQLPPAAGAKKGDSDRAGDEGVAAGSYQDLLKRAHAARQRGDLDSAEQLYRAALAQNPGDTEALSGLGDIAKARGDKSASVGYYEEVNKQNPGYVPALIGLADAKWDAGDKSGAVALYQQVVSATSGQGPYAARARQRISEASKPAEPAPTEPAPPPTEPTPSTESP
jgi:tetratricopeptide (TPR) repeat protein